MPLGLVFVKDRFAAPVKIAVYGQEPLMHILMYSAFTDIKHLCRSADGGVVIDYVLRDLDHPIFNIVLHSYPQIRNFLYNI